MTKLKTNQLQGVRQTSLTLQQRLAQLLGSNLTTLINPFGLVESNKIIKVLNSVIVVRESGEKPIVLSPLGLQIMTINKRPRNANTKKFSIALNSIAGDGEKNRLKPSQQST